MPLSVRFLFIKAAIQAPYIHPEFVFLSVCITLEIKAMIDDNCRYNSKN